MQQHSSSTVSLTAALRACAHQPELLNSERIEKQFGNYKLTVLAQGVGERRSSLNSAANGTQTCRTYAVAQFVDANITEIAAPHKDVLAGQSIGTTFRDSGWTIFKDTLHIGTLAIPEPQHPIGQLMRLTQSVDLAVHVYRMTLEKDGLSIQYATIIEAHHPDYMTEAVLLELYPIDQEQPISPLIIAPLLAMVAKTD